MEDHILFSRNIRNAMPKRCYVHLPFLSFNWCLIRLRKFREKSLSAKQISDSFQMKFSNKISWKGEWPPIANKVDKNCTVGHQLVKIRHWITKKKKKREIERRLCIDENIFRNCFFLLSMFGLFKLLKNIFFFFLEKQVPWEKWLNASRGNNFY